MNHLPFPEESTSPYSYATDSPASAQSPYQVGSSFTTAPYSRDPIPMTQTTTSAWASGSGQVSSASGYSPKHVDYPMPTACSPSVSSPASEKQVKGPCRASQSLSHTHHSIRLKGSMTTSRRSSSPRASVSPIPAKRSLNKKPPLACLFCRARKIACGPPPPGSNGKTCK
jgi:hypothetical protein